MATGSLERPVSGLRLALNIRLRRAIGLTQDPPPRCDDPEDAYCGVDAVARLVHGDLASMLVGGIASLFFQMLHPHAMAGVAQHSRYQQDPFGRMLQTANFIGFTTYGTTASAHAAIARVLAVHEGVRGVADDGVSYAANDPHLLSWVHCAEISMFYAGYERYGRHALSHRHADRYVAEMAQLATVLGAEYPPQSAGELRERLDNFRPELRLSDDGVVARDWLRFRAVDGFVQRRVLAVLIRSAVDLLPDWAQERLGIHTPRWQLKFLYRPLTRALSWTIRRIVPPTRPTFSL